MHGALARTFALAGRKEHALEVLRKLEDYAKTRYVSPLEFAWIQFALGDINLGFHWMQKALEDRSFDLISINVDPRFDALKGDPPLRGDCAADRRQRYLNDPIAALACAVEHPHVVLLSVRSAQLFGRAKASSTFLQLIAKNDRHLAVRGRDPVCEIKASPSHSELRSNRASNGLPSMMMLRCTATVGSRCSIFTKPPCTTGTTTGLSADASRFRVHSPLKSGFCI